jgi:S1-C subfamily serine protease
MSSDPSPFTELSSAARAALAAAGPSTVAVGRHGRGTGVVVAPDRVLTNSHNLRDRTSQITFADGSARQGHVVGSDPDHDLVVIGVETADAPPIAWSERELDAGDVVFAVARALHGTRVSFGLVSSVGRSFRGPRGRRIRGAVEHSAPLARGSSGGPLVDHNGRLVGINTHRLGEGFYLAQPADDELRRRVDQLVAGAHLRSPRLGIAVVGPEESARLRRRVGLPPQPGLLVRDVVEGSAAGAAGIAEGDLVTAVGGHPVADVDDLWDALEATGDHAEVELLRGAEPRSVTVSFAATEDDAGSPS